MIKRRFYNQEHAGNSDESDSSSSDSELEAEPDQDSDFEDHAVPKTNAPNRSSSSSSGYKSEDGSENEVDVDSSAVYNRITEGNAETLGSHHTLRAEISADSANCILKCKSVFKCRLCPRIVCLNQEAIKAHISSKKHARSEKLLKEGRLKVTLTSDGELDEEQETHAERHARIISLAQKNPTRKNKGRQRQRQRLKKKQKPDDPSMRETRPGNTPAKKKHKVHD